MGFISNRTGELISDIEHQMMSRAYQAAQALKKAELQVLRGQGGGRRYRVPGTGAFYTASAPGQPPAVRTGAYRSSYVPRAEQKSGKQDAHLFPIYECPINQKLTEKQFLQNGRQNTHSKQILPWIADHDGL